MATTAQAGIVGFGPQAGKGGTPPSWYRHRATLVDLAPIDETREGPPEVGGKAVPTFPYKSGPVIAGGLSILPRFENTLGWLLFAMMGDHQATQDPYNMDVYDHAFTMAADSTYVPWMGFRKHIPRHDGVSTTDLGETYKDCKIVGATLALPNDAPLGMRLDVVGREFEMTDDPTAWTWANTFEDWESIPVACSVGGYLKIDGAELPVVAAQVGWQNVPLDLRMERVYGDPYLEDVTIIQRRLAYDITVKWNNPDLYREVLTGSSSGTTWDSAPFTASFEVKAVSSVDMPGETEPYSLIIAADEVMMGLVGGITLAGNGAVMMRFTGVALDATNYATFTLRNKVATYTWPV